MQCIVYVSNVSTCKIESSNRKYVVTSLKKEFSSTSPCCFKINKGTDVLGPFVLGDKAMAGLKISARDKIIIFKIAINLNNQEDTELKYE